MNITGIKNPLGTVLLVLVLGTSLFGLVAATLQNQALEPHLPLLFFLNLSGVLVLAVVLFIYSLRLYRRLQNKEPGMRLTVRLVRAYVLLMLVTICVFYLFAYFALNRSVDATVNLRMNEALTDAVQLGQVSIDARRDAVVDTLDGIGNQLATIEQSDEISALLKSARDALNLTEIVYLREYDNPVTGAIGVSDIQLKTLDAFHIDEALAQIVKVEQPAWQLAYSEDSAVQWRILMKFPIEGTVHHFFLQSLTTLPRHYQELGDSIAAAKEDYSGFLYLLGSLRLNLVLALSFVAIILLMLSTWIAFMFAQRLVKPIKSLSEGTQAVASGDYDKQLEVDSSDDIGVLVKSFNDMTNKIRSANTEVRESQARAEDHRTYLETVLTHLSTGVIFIDVQSRISDLNLAAGQILRIQQDQIKMKFLSDLREVEPQLFPLCEFLENGISEDKTEWEGTIEINTEEGQLSWICSVTKLPVTEEMYGSYVVVIEDVSLLVRAQRVVAWGEVSQRFAHEICNPLTPIQLSVEHIHLKTLDKLPVDLRPSIERSFTAIFRQLQSMQNIVEEFRDYAKISHLNLEPINLNDLIRDVAELHFSKRSEYFIELDLGVNVGEISADPNRMVQVFNNLIINSGFVLRDVPDAKITISTRRESNDVVTVKIRDNGHGFKPSLLNKVFEPYATTKDKGTGLGLAIVHRIITSHGGSVVARNPVAGGAEVVIEFITNSSKQQTVELKPIGNASWQHSGA